MCVCDVWYACVGLRVHTRHVYMEWLAPPSTLLEAGLAGVACCTPPCSCGFSGLHLPSPISQRVPALQHLVFTGIKRSELRLALPVDRAQWPPLGKPLLVISEPFPPPPQLLLTLVRCVELLGDVQQFSDAALFSSLQVSIFFSVLPRYVLQLQP